MWSTLEGRWVAGSVKIVQERRQLLVTVEHVVVAQPVDRLQWTRALPPRLLVERLAHPPEPTRVLRTAAHRRCLPGLTIAPRRPCRLSDVWLSADRLSTPCAPSSIR